MPSKPTSKRKTGPVPGTRQKPPEEALSAGIEVRLTPGDHQMVADAAKSLALTRSRFARDAILERARAVLGTP